MKLQINYYIFRLMRENMQYITALLILVIAIIFSIFFFVTQYSENNEKYKILVGELTELQKKADLINYKNEVLKEGINLEEMNTLFSQLVPDEEDYFSIIFALEKISRDTNFIINSYAVSLRGATPSKLPITVNGVGDQSSFITFLKNYNFIGGRLITIDKISYTTIGFTNIELTVNFYSKSDKTKTASPQLSKYDREIIKKVKEKVQIEIKTKEENITYPTKTNPF